MAFSFGMSVDTLIFKLHRELLTMLSNAAGKHFEGISQAAKWHHKQGRLPSAMAHRIERVDHSYHVTRHATAVSCQDLLDKVASLLGDGPQPAAQAPMAAPRELESGSKEQKPQQP